VIDEVRTILQLTNFLGVSLLRDPEMFGPKHFSHRGKKPAIPVSVERELRNDQSKNIKVRYILKS